MFLWLFDNYIKPCQKKTLKITFFLFVYMFLIISIESNNVKLYKKFKVELLTDEEIEEARLQTKEMFKFGFDNYKKYAYPLDELNPIYCSGRGPDYKNP